MLASAGPSAQASSPPTPPHPASMRSMDLSGFLQRVRENNAGLEELPSLTPWLVEGVVMGYLKPR